MYIFLVLFHFIVCCFGAYVSTQIRNENWPVYSNLIISLMISIGWMIGLKFSKIPLVNVGSITDVSSALGFFIGLLLLGTPIKPMQILGILFLLGGLYLINK